MAFLPAWRLDLSADLLRATDATIGAVARQVGYGSAFALSRAFKRAHGVSIVSTGRALPDLPDTKGGRRPGSHWWHDPLGAARR
ncbi:MAG TPA: helix-turn-helix domain-containing protein, partial [Jiangellaceae bacterium]|nr:helix-turn-helix domain-containing protein [Jiangellaceae bacterium]